MKKILTDGSVIQVDKERCEDCECGETRCPFLKVGEWIAKDPMDRNRMTWHCFLHGVQVDFLWDTFAGKFDAQRTTKCLSLDTDKKTRDCVKKHPGQHLVPRSFGETHDFAGFK